MTMASSVNGLSLEDGGTSRAETTRNRTSSGNDSEIQENLISGEHSEKSGKRKKSAADGAGKRSSIAKKDGGCTKQNNRSRRLVANARERSRIHILSDAFENLRRAVPSYSQDQKLSKLAILKLATYYISALANLAESDTSTRSLRQFAECVAHCTKALQTEGRARRMKHF